VGHVTLRKSPGLQGECMGCVWFMGIEEAYEA
jgi:hypothetical protein